MRRGQMNLPALGVALLVLTTAAGISFGMADRAYLAADRNAESRQVAVALSERLVSSDSTLTRRPNVLDADTVESFDGGGLTSEFPVAADHDVRLRLGDEVIAERGAPDRGPTIRRIVLVEREQTVSLTPQLSDADPAFTLPRRATRVRISIQPPDGTTVTVVRANGRVVLRNIGGLRGEFLVRLSRFETTRLAFDADGPLRSGSVRATYYPTETRKAVLTVTVDE